MKRRMRAWKWVVGATLALGCNQGSQTGESNTGDTPPCSAKTTCPAGSKCNYGDANPSNPQSVGKCEYQLCGLTQLCAKDQGCVEDATATCDKYTKDHFCGCVTPNSEEIPNPTPTTGHEGGTK